jgi:hypothetical protein
MNSDVSATGDDRVGVPLWLVADALGMTTRQVRRLEERGVLRSWHEGLARVYGLDEVRRLARKRQEEARRDARVSRPSDAAIRVLEHGMAPDLCRALVRDRRVPPERAFWSYLMSAVETKQGITAEEAALIGDLASVAMHSRARGGERGPE